MGRYNLRIKLLSDTIIGSAEGYSSTIDKDVIFDDVGLPYIPARRVKGLLKDSAEEVSEMFRETGMGLNVKTEDIFGRQGETGGQKRFSISNLYLPEYRQTKQYLEYCMLDRDAGLGISTESIKGFFCSIRAQTSIDSNTGTAREHSLRTARVVSKGYEFWGEIIFDDAYRDIVGFACLNIRRMGTKRNRGFGRINVRLFNGNNTLDITSECSKVLEGKI